MHQGPREKTWKTGGPMGTDFAEDQRMALGRLLAYCAHPAAAWRRISKGDRTLVIAAYFGAGYVLTLVALLAV